MFYVRKTKKFPEMFFFFFSNVVCRADSDFGHDSPSRGNLGSDFPIFWFFRPPGVKQLRFIVTVDQQLTNVIIIIAIIISISNLVMAPPSLSFLMYVIVAIMMITFDTLIWFSNMIIMIATNIMIVISKHVLA